MADSSYGLRDISIDLTVAGARVIRDAALGKEGWTKISCIEVIGTTGLGAGPLILRWESATGPICFNFGTLPNSSAVWFTSNYSDPLPFGRGLYMDAITTAWGAGAAMVIHTA